MSRKTVVFAALIVSGLFATASAADMALFSNAGQLNAGKAMLSEGGIAGVSGKTAADASFTGVKTMKFSGGDLFSSSLTAGSKLATPDVASKFAKFGAEAGTSGLLSKGLAARSSLLAVTK